MAGLEASSLASDSNLSSSASAASGSSSAMCSQISARSASASVDLRTRATAVRGASRDPDDDKVLALAVTGQADAIITCDVDLLAIVVWEGIPILTPAEFVHRLGD
jgi:predicted nucleic acid-binding protein